MKTITSSPAGKATWILALGCSLTLLLAGCRDREVQEMELLAKSSTADSLPSAEPSPFVEREFWLALAEEPRWHLDQARTLFQDQNYDMASVEMAKAAALLNFESRHSHSPREEGLLLASVEEVREVARDLRFQNNPDRDMVSLQEMDRVAGLAFRSIAAHQVTLGRDALMDGDGRMAGALIRETAHALEAGFQRAHIDLGNAMTQKLRKAREVGLRMQLNGDGTRVEGLEVLDNLDSAVTALGNTITNRRK